MKSKNDIDHLFRNNLATPANDMSGFNPDDKVWENAHAEIKLFYKEKKRRRLFLFLLFLVASRICYLFFPDFGSGENSTALTNTVSNSIKEKKVNTVLNLSNRNSTKDTLEGKAKNVVTKTLDLNAKPDYKGGQLNDIKSNTRGADLPMKSVRGEVDFGKLKNNRRHTIPHEDTNSPREIVNENPIGSNVKELTSKDIFIQPIPLKTAASKMFSQSVFDFEVSRPKLIAVDIFKAKWLVGLGHSRFVSNPFVKDRESSSQDETIKLIGASYHS